MKEFTFEEACEFATNRGKNTRFYLNVWGWSSYYTLEPTLATPTGRARGFKRTQIFKAN